MLQQTQGIVLKTFKYSETSLIVRIYTEKKGIQSYMINRVRHKQAKIKPALLQSLSLLDMVVYHRQNKKIQRIKEIKLAYIFTTIPFDTVRSSIALFITEILYKTIKEEEANTTQFEFLQSFIQYLDLTKQPIGNLHLWFMLHWSAFLGFLPQNNFEHTSNVFFAIEEGIFCSRRSKKKIYVDAILSEKLSKLLSTSLQNLHQVVLTRQERQQLLQALILFYQTHIEGFGNVQSVKILQVILS